MTHAPSGERIGRICRSADAAICSGQPPVDATFQMFSRPVRFVVNVISFPFGDQEPPEMARVTNRSSSDTGLAAGFFTDTIVAGSVTVRSSGEPPKTNNDEARRIA